MGSIYSVMDEKKLAKNYKVREEIIKLLKERESSYGYVMVSTALSMSEKENIWKNIITEVEVLHKDEEKPPENKYNYKNFSLSKVILKSNDFVKLLDKIVEDNILAIKDLPEIKIEGAFEKADWMRLIPSNDRVFGLNWPCNGYNFASSTKESFPSGPFVSSNLPLFPDGRLAIRNMIGLDLSKYDQYCGNILIFLPKYKAKIKEIRIGSKQLTWKIVCKEVSSKDVLGKAYIEGEFGTKSEQFDITFGKETVVLPLKYEPQYIYVLLLDRRNDEIIDERRFYLAWRELPPDVILEMSTEEIETIIKRGENEKIEFKINIPKSTEELAKTVVAFANTFGGTILIGVNDNAEVLGFSDLKGEERLRNILRSYCEPPINPIIEIKNVQEKPILLIHVNEGKDKPYTIRGKGAFIRSGSTNRVTTRDELDEFFKKKGSYFYYR